MDAVDVADAVDADEIDKLCKCFAHCTVQGKNQLCKPLHSAQSKVKINFIV